MRPDTTNSFNGWMSRVAILGAVLGAVLLSLGSVWLAVAGAAEHPVAGSHLLRSLPAGILSGDPVALLRLGVLVVLVLPPALTAVGGVAFARRGNWKDALWSGAVLAVLALSLLLARTS